MTGSYIMQVQQILKDRGFNPGRIDGVFGEGTKSALIAFQQSENIIPDGVLGPVSEYHLGMRDTPQRQSITLPIDEIEVAKAFRSAPLKNIKKYLPYIESSLKRFKMDDKVMAAMVFGTIAAETSGFEPISEGISRYNTSPNGHNFDLYDNRKDLGNKGFPDGSRFKGRGFVQLTGRFNYQKMDSALKLGGELLKYPEKANEPDIASDIMMVFLKSKEYKIRSALANNDLRATRRTVNGGSHGLDRFRVCYFYLRSRF